MYMGMCTFYFFTIRYNTDTDKTIPIRYDTKPLKNSLFPFGLLVYSAYSIIVFRYHNFPNDVKMKTKHAFNNKKKKSFLCQTSSIIINIIISIVKSIVYLSFRYNTGISFMIAI